MSATLRYGTSSAPRRLGRCLGSMDTLDDLLERFEGHPIPHCPGRYVLRGVDRTKGPMSLVETHGIVTEHVVAYARDKVVVTRLGERGGVGSDLLRSARRDVAAHSKYAGGLRAKARRARCHASLALVESPSAPGDDRSCCRNVPGQKSAPVMSLRLRPFPSWQAYSYRTWSSEARLSPSYLIVQGCVKTFGSSIVAW